MELVSVSSKLFENLPVLPYRCSKINPSLFSKIIPSFFTIKEGSTSHLGLLPSGKKRKPLLPVALNRFALRLAFFSKTYLSFLTLKEGSTAFPKPFSPQGTRDVTAPPVALNRYAIRLAGHQSPRHISYAGWDRLAESLVESGGHQSPRQGCFCGDEPAGVNTC